MIQMTQFSETELDNNQDLLQNYIFRQRIMKTNYKKLDLFLVLFLHAFSKTIFHRENTRLKNRWQRIFSCQYCYYYINILHYYALLLILKKTKQKIFFRPRKLHVLCETFLKRYAVTLGTDISTFNWLKFNAKISQTNRKN